MHGPLHGQVALVTGGTRVAGRGMAAELGAAGVTVYVTGRSTRESHSPLNRPETIEDTAELVTKAGGQGIEVTDGDDTFNDHYRDSMFFDMIRARRYRRAWWPSTTASPMWTAPSRRPAGSSPTRLQDYERHRLGGLAKLDRIHDAPLTIQFPHR